jgi:hypothetical protein
MNHWSYAREILYGDKIRLRLKILYKVCLYVTNYKYDNDVNFKAISDKFNVMGICTR